jgi:dTDP-4-dehydrorhamnose reductase
VNNLGYELAPKPLVAFEMFLARLSSKRSVFPILTRSASSVTRPRGLAAILEKKPDDVVITFAKRTAVGRAKKGQLKDAPVDEILHALFKVLNPQI